MQVERIAIDKLSKKEWLFSFMGQSGKNIVLTRFTNYTREDTSKKWSKKDHWDFRNQAASNLKDAEVPLPDDVSAEVHQSVIADYRVITTSQFFNSI